MGVKKFHNRFSCVAETNMYMKFFCLIRGDCVRDITKYVLTAEKKS